VGDDEDVNADADDDGSDQDEDLHSEPEIDKTKSTVLLIHFSVKEYLVSVDWEVE
jgi:hypothetical protein